MPIPKPYVNDVKQDNSTVKYVEQGEFGKLEIGARASGMPKTAASENMSLEHVGGSQGKGK